jgi:hypothetical protein
VKIISAKNISYRIKAANLKMRLKAAGGADAGRSGYERCTIALL